MTSFVFFTVEEEERVTGKNLKQAESLACTKNRTRELNTAKASLRISHHCIIVLVVELLASCGSAQSSSCEVCVLRKAHNPYRHKAIHSALLPKPGSRRGRDRK